MINEYAPPRLRGWLTGLVDCWPSCPSIVFGFWALEALNRYVSGPVSWIAAHFGFIPIFRTTEPGTYYRFGLRLRPHRGHHDHSGRGLGQPGGHGAGPAGRL